jgi:hypothetical protein
MSRDKPNICHAEVHCNYFPVPGARTGEIHPRVQKILVFFEKNLQIKHKTLDDGFKLKYCTGEQDISLSILYDGVSQREQPVFKSLGILLFSSACLISPPTIIRHLIISPGVFRGNKRVVRG